jgi:endonuclease/exonuclease/phosphatase family metal-dependent hydrolase
MGLCPRPNASQSLLVLALLPLLAQAALPKWLGLPPSEAYGRVLNRFNARVNNSDRDVLVVAKFAWRHVGETGALCSARHSRSSPRVVLASKHILEYSMDGHTPQSFIFSDERGLVQERPIVLGINYYFNLEWDEEGNTAYGSGGSGFRSCGVTQVHRFVVTRDRKDSLAVLSHTRLTRPHSKCAKSTDCGAGAGRAEVHDLETLFARHVACAAAAKKVHVGGKGRPGRQKAQNVSLDISLVVGECGKQDVSQPMPKRAVRRKGGWFSVLLTQRAKHVYSFRRVPPAVAAALEGETGPQGRVVHLRTKYLTPGYGECHLAGWSPWRRRTGGHANVRPGSSPSSNSGFSSNTASSGNDALRIVSYNIWNINLFDDNLYRARLRHLSEQIRSERPDIFALQEMRHDVQRDHQPETFAALFPDYNFVFQAAMSYPEKVHLRVEEGLAVYSKYPIVSSDYILLPRDRATADDVHQCICLYASIAHPEHGNISVFVSHLSLDERARDRSVVAIVEWMQRFPLPQLLMGDLNAEPNTPAMRFLNSQQELLGVHANGLFDIWLHLRSEPRTRYDEFEDGHDEAGRWAQTDPGLTFSTLDLWLIKRIDYVYACFDLVVHRITAVDTVPRTGWPLRCPKTGVVASDHVGLSFAL